MQEEGDTTMLKDARVYGLHCNLHRALALENAARYRVTRAGNVRRAHVRSRRNKERRLSKIGTVTLRNTLVFDSLSNESLTVQAHIRALLFVNNIRVCCSSIGDSLTNFMW